MTTITLENGDNLKKTNFLNIDELINYLLKNEGYGMLHSVDENNTTPEQKKRFEKARKTDKSNMLNI